jgi:ribose-phosphate pyrophosphokinase
MQTPFLVMATRSMKHYARSVAQLLTKYPSFSGFAEIDSVDSLETDIFADGELEVSVNTSIRGKDVYLFSNSARNDAGIPLNESKIELYHAVDALKRAQASKIIVFEPFVSASRSDRTTRRNSVGLWIHFKTLSSLGASHIITYQLHSDKSKTMLDPSICAIDDIPGLHLLKKRLCDVYIKDVDTLEHEVRNNWAFCSVDAGGEKMARRFANAFGAHLIIAHKQRDYSKANTVESINILSAVPVKGKILWIVDDMIDTAGSVESLIQALMPMEPAEINLAALHPVFSGPAGERLSKLSQNGKLKHIIVSDTVACPSCISDSISHLEVVPSTEMSASIIGTVSLGKSLSSLFVPFNAANYLGRPRLL